MIKYLILCLFSGMVMGTEGGKEAAKPTMSMEDFQNFLTLCRTHTLSQEQCQMMIDAVPGLALVKEPKTASVHGSLRKRLVDEFNKENLEPNPKKAKVENGVSGEASLEAEGTAAAAELKLKPLPKGVRIYKLSETLTYARGPKNIDEKGRLIISPSKPKNAIYTHFLVDDYWDRYIPIEDRIDVNKILPEIGVTDVAMLSQDTHLHNLLLEVEKKVRHIFKNEQVLRAIIYVGLAECFVHRSYGHGSDIAHAGQETINRKTKKKEINLGGRKVNYETKSMFEGHSVRMSYLIENIPEKYLHLFETLLANLTFAFDFGASAEIGKNESWQQWNTYQSSDMRDNGLKDAGFNYEIEALRKELRRIITGLDSKLEQCQEESGSVAAEFCHGLIEEATSAAVSIVTEGCLAALAPLVE